MITDGDQPKRAIYAIGLGLLAALFFTMTYVLNRASASGGGYWAWTASLRYFITLPLLLPLMTWRSGIRPVWQAIRAHPLAWIRCSGIGFVLFYSLLSFAATSGPSWLIAGSFQFTVIAGMLCAPFLYQDERKKIPLSGLLVALIILGGVFLMQLGHSSGFLDLTAWIALACVLLSAIAFPLGNRMLLLHLEKTETSLTSTQRVFGMTLVSQPLWLLLALFAWQQSGPPPSSQILLAGGVALSAGVIASILFYQATGLVRKNPIALGAVEAMQASELLIAIGLGAAFLNEAWPHGLSLFGSVLVILGIVAFAALVTVTSKSKPTPTKNETVTDSH